MKKRKQNKNKKPSNFGGLFIQKRTDKNGNNYFLDRKGKRKSGLSYSAQWGKTGRVSKESYNKTIEQINREGIKDIKEIRLISNDYETIRRAKPLRKKELEIIESKLTKNSLFFNAVEAVKDADKGGAIIRILTPTNNAYREFSGAKGLETAYRFIDSVGKALEEIKETDTDLKSPVLFFRFQHNIKENTFYFDFKNLVGLDDFILLQQLVKDNFKVGG